MDTEVYAKVDPVTGAIVETVRDFFEDSWILLRIAFHQMGF